MPNSIGSLRLRKRELYALAGALGGAVGAALAELVLTNDSSSLSRGRAVFEIGLWSAVFASVVGLSLFLAGEWHQRREIKADRAARVLAISAAAGFISGSGAQALYGMDFGSFELKNYALRIAVWAIMGALLGSLLSRSVPNLGLVRGAGAGAAGGALGCIAFICTSLVLPGPAGRVVGITLLGLSLGLAIYYVENMFREASVEVEWAPYETTRVGLGAQPVTIGGGGEEHIFKKGLPPHVSSIVFQDGVIEHVETANGKRTPLQDGSRLRIGSLNLSIHAVASANGPQGSTTRNVLITGSILAAVLIGASALTILGPHPSPGARTADGGRKITTLNNIGDSAKLDTSEPITEVNIRLQWQAAVDLDLNAYYTTKDGESGVVYYANRTGPNMRLDTDAGVGDLGGKNEENITINGLEGYREILFATKIFSKGGSYSDYDGRVEVSTNNGDTVQVPLTSVEMKPYLVIAKLTNGPDGPTITNLNDAVDCEELTALLGRGECVPIKPKG